MLIWYAFAALYARASRGVSRTRAVRLWDLAVVLLDLSTTGAWGLSLMGPLGITDLRAPGALLHLFLDLFSEGWLVVATLGLAWDRLAPAARGLHPSLALLALGLPLGFLLAVPAADLGAGGRIVAGVGGVLGAAGLAAQVVLLWPLAAGTRRWIWRVPLVLLTVAVMGRLLAAVLPGLDLLGLEGLRVLYLHLLLLGFVTLGLWAAAETSLGEAHVRLRPALPVTVLLLIASLLPLTAFWPIQLAGPWALDAASAVAVLPALAVLAALLRRRKRTAGTMSQSSAARGPEAPGVVHPQPAPSPPAG
jgi:hypothetical protein